MNRGPRQETSNPTDRSNRSPGFTLLEVVVGLMLMAALVVSALTALSRYQSVLKDAGRKRQAIAVADDLLQRWSDSPAGLPGSAAGTVPTDPTLGWRTRVVAQRSVCGMPAEVIRLDVWEQRLDEPEPRVLASVEYLRRRPLRGLRLGRLGLPPSKPREDEHSSIFVEPSS